MIDTQIVEEEFLEDINNILNSGEVPNLFEGDDYEKIILEARDHCNEVNKEVMLYWRIVHTENSAHSYRVVPGIRFINSL